MTPILHFAHANGFPAGSYRKMLDILRAEYTVIAVERFGHNPDFPVDDNWASLVRELISNIESQAQGPVVGVGHSMGAILTFMAAHQRPDLFRQIVMLDPPLLYGASAFLFFIAKRLGLVNRSPMVAQTKKRRTHWATRDEAAAYFAGKKLFGQFDPDCLRDYVQSATIPTEAGVDLLFDRNVEANIYRTTPHNLGSLRSRLGVPGAMIIGEHTYATTRYTVGGFVKRHGLHFGRFEGGSHLFPLEHPERTAEMVRLVLSGEQMMQ